MKAERPAAPARTERLELDRTTRTFAFGRDLSSRAGVQLEQLATLQRTLPPGQEMVDHVLFDQLSGSLKNSFERSTRDMLEDLLLDATEIERHVERLTERFRSDGTDGSAEPIPGAYPRRELDFDFTIRGIVPGVKMELEGRRSEMKLRVDVRGRVGFGYYDRRLGRAGLWVGYDGDGRFDVSARLGF